MAKYNSKAIQLFNKAIELGKKQKKSVLAIKSYQKCLHIEPNFYQAHCNLANLYNSRHEYKNALLHSRKAFELNPKDLSVVKNYTATLLLNEEYDSVVSIINKYPLDDQILLDLLVHAYEGTRKYDDAESTIVQYISKYGFSVMLILNAIDRASKEKSERYLLALDTLLISFLEKNSELFNSDPGLFFNTYMKDENISKFKILFDIIQFNSFSLRPLLFSLVNYIESKNLAPNDVPLYNGLIQKEQGRFDSAIKEFKKIRGHDKDPYIISMITDCYFWKGDVDTAKKYLNKLPANRSTSPYFYVWSLFQDLKLETAWRFLSGIKTKTNRIHFLSPKLTTLAEAENKAVLIFRDQGIGDEIQYLSALRLFEKKANAKKIYLEVSPRLLNIAENSFTFDNFEVASADPNRDSENQFQWLEDINIDYHISLRDLNGLVHTEISCFDGTAYLSASPELSKEWGAILNGISNKPKIGFAWKGGGYVDASSAKSLSLDAFSPLFNNLNATFINLQYGDVADELNEFKVRTGYDIVHFDNINPLEEIDSQFALIKNLDYVVQISNASLHIAGSLGICSFLVLGNPRDYRWFSTKFSDGFSPWYNSVKMYAREEFNSTEELFTQISREIQNSIDSKLVT